jgi:hypothetical protein
MGCRIDLVVSIMQSRHRNKTSSIVVVNTPGVIALIFIGASHRRQSGGVGIPTRAREVS